MRVRPVFLMFLVACGAGSRQPATAVPSNTKVEIVLPNLRLHGDGERVVAQWGTQRECHLSVLAPPAAPTAQVTFTPARAQTNGSVCGPVAVTADALYFAEQTRVARWKDGVTSTVLELPPTNAWKVFIAIVDDSVYVTHDVFDTTTFTRIDVNGSKQFHEEHVTRGGDLLVVGDAVVFEAYEALHRIRGTEVTMLLPYKDGESEAYTLGATKTELVQCGIESEGDLVEGRMRFVPITGGPIRRTKQQCIDEHVIGNDLYATSFPPPTKLTRRPISGGESQLLATEPGQIGDVAASSAWVVYVVRGKPGDDLGKLAWVKR